MMRASFLGCALVAAGCGSLNPTARYAKEIGYVTGPRAAPAVPADEPVGRREPAGAPAAMGAHEARMIRIPAGSFMMGSNDGDPDERPVHEVDVAAFEMDETEVTVAAYRACVDAGKCTAPDTGWRCNWGKPDRGTHPVNCVDWEQSKAFCEWAGKRLPTEEEWEYAARGKEGRKYPWGNEEPGDQLCWKRSDASCVVGSYPSGETPTGLKDMAGNVWEWTSSGYSEDYSKNRSTSKRVGRGGCWIGGVASEYRSARRYGFVPAFRGGVGPSFRVDDLGLRCAR